MMSPQTPIVSIKNLSVTYRNQSRPVLEDIHLDICDLETVLVVGPSGGGKSTLARVVSGLVPFSIDADVRGEVLLEGVPITKNSASQIRRTTRILFQNPSDQILTDRVDHEIALGLEHQGLAPSSIQEIVNQTLSQYRLTSVKERNPRSLSIGEQQRVMLAALLAQRPRLLILDEPTSSLDGFEAKEFLLHLQRARALSPLSVLVIEHQVDEWLPLTDRMVFFTSQGRIMTKERPHIACLHPTLFDASVTKAPAISQVFRYVGRTMTQTQQLSIEAWNNIVTDLHETAKRPSVPAQETALSIHRLGFSQGGQTILKDVSISFPKGQISVLLGPNGAGKTTLLQHLIHSPKPKPQSIFLFGKDLSAMSHCELSTTIAYGFQDPEHGFTSTTVQKELESSLMGSMSNPATQAARFGLTPRLQSHPFWLSHGEKRRLQLACLLQRDPNIIILDEPTSGLDQSHEHVLMEALKQFCAVGGTVIVVTHDPDLVHRYADHVALLVEGHMLYEGHSDGFFASQKMLDAAHLLPPPLIRLSRRLCDKDSSAQTLISLEELYDFVYPATNAPNPPSNDCLKTSSHVPSWSLSNHASPNCSHP